MSSVPSVQPDWYFWPRIPKGALTLVYGAAGIGKSTACLDILARASIADRMPCSLDLPQPPNDVKNMRSLLLGLEDTPSRVRGLLEAAGADLDNVGIIDQQQLPDPSLSALEQMDWLESQVVEFGAACVYLDNVSAALLSDKTDSHNEASVRRALRPLDLLAKKLNIAVLMVSHPHKGATNVHEGMAGSMGFVNLARSVLYAATVNSEMAAIAVAKSNYVPAHLVNTLAFTLKSEKLGERDGMMMLGTPTVEWFGSIPFTAQGLMDLNAKMRKEGVAKTMQEAIVPPGAIQAQPRAILEAPKAGYDWLKDVTPKRAILGE